MDSNKIIRVSAKIGSGIAELENAIEKRIQTLFKSMKSRFLLSERQYNIISELNNQLKSIEKKNTNRIQYELISYHIKEMLEMISQLTGKSIEKKIIDKIFSSNIIIFASIIPPFFTFSNLSYF